MRLKLVELKRTENSKIIVEDSNTLVSILDRTTRQKTNKEINDLNTTIRQEVLTHTYRKLYSTTADYNYSQVDMDHPPG